MMNIIRYLLILLAISFSIKAESCMEPTYPDLENLDKYSEIFIGEVTGIVLDFHERNLLFLLRRKDNSVEVDDSKKGFLLRAVVEKQIKGKTKNPYQIQILDCGIGIPNPKMYGVFFIEKDTKRAIPVFENQGELYYESINAIAKETY